MAYDTKLAERIRANLKSTKGMTEKSMFGGVGFLVNGNMACGVNKQDLIVRLSDEDFEDSLKRKHVRVFDFAGRPMKGWVFVAAAGLASDQALQSWIDKGVAFAASLPVKSVRHG